jgi:Ras-related protein Rab-6A
MQFWDTAGQEGFRSLVPSYIRRANVAILVYDVTSGASFDGLKTWHQSLLDLAVLPCVVVGNKIDLSAPQAVSTADGKEFGGPTSAQKVDLETLPHPLTVGDALTGASRSE